MRKLFLILGVGATMLFTSCSDKLDLKPFNQLETSVALQTPTDFQNALRGAYGGLRRVGYYGGRMILYPDALTDNLILNSQGRFDGRLVYEWRYDAESGWSGMYLDPYQVIGRVNIILANIGSLPDGPVKDAIRGEALALRGMCHFDMMRVFGKAPAFATANDLGVPYVKVADVNIKPSRETVASNMENILADMLEAYNLITTSTADNTRLNKRSLAALLSRVYLYAGDYVQAEQYAKECIALGADVTPAASLQLMYRDGFQGSIIFRVRHTDNDLPNPAERNSIGVQYSQTTPNGIRSEFNIEYSFYQQFGDNDLRKPVIFTTSNFNGRPYNHIAKYLGRGSGTANQVDTKVIRAEEVHLTLAEALAEQGKDGEALTALDQVRSRRYAGFVSGGETGTALKNAIALERRKELCFEGHHFFDLKRKNLGVQRSNFGDEADGGGVPTPFTTLAAGSFRFQLPIPQDAINANPSLNGQQNPGY
jgi:starch-binding outer membrane protein, SusD/RagB family